MSEKWVDIVQIEEELYTQLSSVVDVVYVNHSPTSVPVKHNSYAIVSSGGSFTKRGSYKRSYGHIYLYVRNKKSGVENTVKIDDLSNRALMLFPIVTDYFSAIGESISYGTQIGEFTRMVIRFELRIKN